MANENPQLTITLTGRAPVTVNKEQWPVIASAKDWDNQHEFQIELTNEIARAAGTDAGNRSMRKAGRSTWNADDYNAAVDEYTRLWPAERAAKCRFCGDVRAGLDLSGHCPLCVDGMARTNGD